MLIATVGFVVLDRYQTGQQAGCAKELTDVRGVIGSEKEAYFADQRVRDRFACAGLRITIDTTGSLEMVQALKNNRYGFAFPGSSATAQKIMTERQLTDSYTPFSSPMAVATFKPIVEVLRRAGAIVPSGGRDAVDVAKLIDLAQQSTAWDQLPGNTEYAQRKTVLLRTTDPQDSNSGLMFLSIVSHVANGGSVVTTPEQIGKLMPALCRLVFDQGEQVDTSQVLFNTYLTGGAGQVPLGLIYEAQFVAEAPGLKPQLSDDMVMLFPKPTVYSRHTVIPIDDTGRRVVQALRDDPELARLAAEHGFRPERPIDNPVSRRTPPVDVVDSPSYEVFESMLAAVAPSTENARRCAK
ncbi:hypothetical protein [Lentzea sp. CA-135723]|uniref:hypothetical protein n=1 Tax=Lentzea sp. CA-135723 TaxID=3239950 RepID=UPI003D9047D4